MMQLNEHTWRHKFMTSQYVRFPELNKIVQTFVCQFKIIKLSENILNSRNIDDRNLKIDYK